MIKDILEAERPDLVVATGDIVSGNKWGKLTRPWAELQYRKLTSVL